MELDKTIKQKLNSRAIQPSKNSWDRMDAMLSLQEKTKKKSFAIYYVAASLFLMLSIGFWFANNSTDGIIPQNNRIVIKNDVAKPTEKKEDKIENNQTILTTKQEQIASRKEVIDQKVIQSSKANENNNKSALALNSNENSKQKAKENTFETKLPTQKVMPNYISPDKLLASIENDSQTEINSSVVKPIKIPVKVNVNSLLSSVNKEMNETYRETSFERIKRNLNEVKVAVTNRNYE